MNPFRTDGVLLPTPRLAAPAASPPTQEMDADSALADAEAAPTLADLGAELSKRLLYQAEELEDVRR